MSQSHAIAAVEGTGSSVGRGATLNNMLIFAKNGMTFTRQLPYDKWLEIGQQLSEVNSSSAWCLGDWLAYGMEAFSGRYRTALEQTSLEYQTLRNYVWVAKRFPLSRRRKNLSFGHHAEVAALTIPEQNFWLCKAEELNWPVKTLRKEVRRSLQERNSVEELPGAEQDETEQRVVSVNIDMDSVLLRTCQTAAEKAGMAINDWVIGVLLRAADSTQSPNAT